MIGSKKYTLSEEGLELYSKVSTIIDNSKYPYIINPCSEIVINAKGGYCLIGSLAPFHSNSLDEIIENGKLLARFLIRANLMDSIYKEEVIKTNRIGIGITGWLEFAYKFFGYGFRDLINETKSQDFWNFIQVLRISNENEADKYSDLLGVNHPSTISTIKPDGSIAKIYGLTEGCHLPARRQYLRWVQFQNNDPLLKEYKSKGYPVKELLTQANVSIVGFLTKPLITTLGMGDKLVTAYEATIEEQFQWLILLEKYWLGSRGNQISYTLKVNMELYSLEEIRQLILKYQPQIRCCSFQPEMSATKLKTLYEYLPEEEISEEEYLSIANNIKETMEVIVSFHELQCASGACPL